MIEVIKSDQRRERYSQPNFDAQSNVWQGMSPSLVCVAEILSAMLSQRFMNTLHDVLR